MDREAAADDDQRGGGGDSDGRQSGHEDCARSTTSGAGSAALPFSGWPAAAASFGTARIAARARSLLFVPAGLASAAAAALVLASTPWTP